MELSLLCANLDAVWSKEDKLLREAVFLRLPDNHNTLLLSIRLWAATLRHYNAAVNSTIASSATTARHDHHNAPFPNQTPVFEFADHILETMWRTLQLLRWWAKLKEGTIVLLSYQNCDNNENQPSLHLKRNDCWIVKSIVELLSLLSGGAHDGGDNDISSTVETEAIGLIKDLSYRSTPMEKATIYQVNGFLSLLTRWCEKHAMEREGTQQHRPSPHVHLEESMAGIVWNLALHPDISRDMIQYAVISRALCYILSSSTNPKARRNAISALGNLIVTSMGQEPNIDTQPATMDARETTNVSFWRDEWLIQSLMARVQHDDDPDTRRRAMRTLRCIVGHCPVLRRERVDLLPFLLHVAVTQPSFLTAHSTTHMETDNGNKKEHLSDDDAPVRHLDTQLQACEALVHLARDQTWLQQQGPQLEAGLISIIQIRGDESRIEGGRPSQRVHPKIILSIARALSLCIEHSPWTRSMSCYSPAFFDNLFEAIRSLNVDDDNPSAHLCVSRLLQQLITIAISSRSTSPSANSAMSAEHRSFGSPSNAMGTHSSNPSSSSKLWFVAHASVLDMLTLFLSEMGKSQEDAFEMSILKSVEVVLSLLNAGENDDELVRAMVEHDGLLTAMVNVCLVTQDQDLKSKVKQAILILVPKL